MKNLIGVASFINLRPVISGVENATLASKPAWWNISASLAINLVITCSKCCCIKKSALCKGLGITSYKRITFLPGEERASINAVCGVGG